MPRDGTGVYTQPFPDVVEGTTIESAKYNGNVNDVEQDLNTPRPIVAGGTGANNAADAMSNLGGEGSKIQVINYDSHNFTAGSFYSLGSATAPPVAGHAFAGICYPAVVSGVATSDMFIEVRDRDEATQPGSLFVRQKKAGVWSGWMKAQGTSMGASPPATPSNGVLWWDPTRGKLFIFYVDADTGQWVETVAVPEIDQTEIIDTVAQSAVRYDVAQTLTAPQQTIARQNVYAAPFDALAYNGMQINGSMEVSQETASGNPITLTNRYICDCWLLSFAGAMAPTATLSTTTTLPGFFYFLRVVVGTAAPTLASMDFMQFQTTIEGYRVARLGWGTSGAMPITIGFWSYNEPGTYSVAVRNFDLSRSYVTTYTQSTAAFEYKTITIPGDQVGVWKIDNSAGLVLSFVMAAGTGRQTAPGVWTAGSFIAALGQTNAAAVVGTVCRITGVVVLPGIEAPSAARSPLIMRPYDQELVTCMRYFQLLSSGLNGTSINTTNAIRVRGTFLAPMRTAPTATTTAAINVDDDFAANFTQSVGSVSTDNIGTNNTSARFFLSNFTGLTVNRYYAVTTAGGKIQLDARL